VGADVIRRTAVRKIRPGTRRGQPTKAEKSAIRAQVYAETGGRCELNLAHPPNNRVYPSEGNVRIRWHLVHLRAKRVHGWGRANLAGGCFQCHIVEMHRKGRKPDILAVKGRE